MLLFAQAPQPDPSDLAKWVLCLLAVIVLIGAAIKWVLDSLVAYKRLREEPPENKKVATHAELAELRTLLNAAATKEELGQLKATLGATATKTELGDLKATVEKLDGYVHSQNHELRDGLNTLTTRVATIVTMMESYQRDIARMMVTLDATTKQLTRVSTLLEGTARPLVLPKADE